MVVKFFFGEVCFAPLVCCAQGLPPLPTSYAGLVSTYPGSNASTSLITPNANQWRKIRGGRKICHKIRGYRGQSGQAIRLFQAPRKISFTFHF